MRILVTRPLPDGARTAETLQARGHAVILSPLMRVEPLAATIPERPYAAVLITSANAPRALAVHPAHARVVGLPVYAVGRASADAAREAGFAQVTSADGDAMDLAALVARQCRNEARPLLYLAGEDRAADLSGVLEAHGLRAETIVIYRAAEAPFADVAVRALSEQAVDAVLHFSKRSAALYIAGADQAGLREQALRPKHYCFAPQTAEALRAAGAQQVVVAPRPQEQALLDLIG